MYSFLILIPYSIISFLEISWLKIGNTWVEVFVCFSFFCIVTYGLFFLVILYYCKRKHLQTRWYSFIKIYSLFSITILTTMFLWADEKFDSKKESKKTYRDYKYAQTKEVEGIISHE